MADKQLAVRYHLLNFLDDQSHSKNYSTRAVAASYCVAGQNDPKLYASFYSALFGSDFQPQENAASDRTDAELAVGVLGGTPDTYHTAGLKRGTATSSSTTPGTTSVNGCGYHIANEGRQLADKMVAKVKGR